MSGEHFIVATFRHSWALLRKEAIILCWLVELVELWNVRHSPRTNVLSAASQGRACGPSPKGLPRGPRRQVDADRAGVGARGEQVECRVVGGRSCVEAVVGFEFYCMERVCASRQELVSPPEWGDFRLRRCGECAS